MQTSQSVVEKTIRPAQIGSLYYLFVFLFMGAWFPYLNVYLRTLNLSGAQIGWLSTLAPVMTLLLATALASLADQTQRRRQFAQIAMLGAAVCLYLLGLPTTFAGIALVMLVYAVFNSPIMALSDGLIARMARRHNLNYGAMRLWGSLMFGVSSVLFGAIWQAVGFGAMFTVAALLFLPAIWTIGRVEEAPADVRQARRPFGVVLRDWGIVLLLLATFLAGIGDSVFLAFGGVYAASLGGGSFLIGLVVAFAGLSELPTMFFGERIGRRLGKVNTVILSYVLMGAAYLGYLLTINASYLPLFSILKGLGYGLWFTMTVRLLIERTPEEWAATAQSLLTVCWFGLSPLVAGPLAGWLYDHLHPGAVYYLSLVALSSAILTIWLAKKRRLLE